MKRLIAIIAALCISPSLAEAHNYGTAYCGTAYCSYAQGAQYGIIRHVDGTYWNSQGTVQYELGAVANNYSPTGWSQYYYALPFKPSQTALTGYQPLAQQGSSIYGYSETTTATYGATPNYQTSAAVYIPDYSQFLNQAARLAEQSQQLNAQAYQGFVSSTTLLNAQAIELAKIDHVRDAAIAALNAAKGPQPESVQRAITLTLKPDSQGNLQVTTSHAEASVNAGSNPTDAFVTVVGNNCAACHSQGGKSPSATDARKHLRLEEFANWDQKTFSAIATAVESGKMPPNHPLSRADKGPIFAMEAYVAGGNKQTAPAVDPTPQPTTQPDLPPPPPIPDQKPMPVPPPTHP